MKRKKKRKNRKDDGDVKQQPSGNVKETLPPIKETSNSSTVPGNFRHIYGFCKCYDVHANKEVEHGVLGESLFDDYYDQLLSVELDLYDDYVSILPRYSTDADPEEIDRDKYKFDIFTAVKPYEIKRLIGQGKHGVIYKVEKDNIEFVAKLARRQSFTRMTMNEFIKIKGASHKNIVKYYEVVKSGYIMELLPRTLKQAILTSPMKSDVKFQISGGLLKGLDYLHGVGIAHLDIKPSNILLDQSNTPKLADFGISKRYLTASGRFIKLFSRCGTFAYMCPELIIFYRQQRRYGVDMVKADMWSCGCTLYEFLTTKLPYGCPKYEELYEKQKINQLYLTRKIRRLMRTDYHMRDLFAIIKSLLTYDPYLRPTPRSIIQRYFPNT